MARAWLHGLALLSQRLAADLLQLSNGRSLYLALDGKTAKQ